ncbi:hypothetical protein [Rhizobium sp. BR 362]|uniref:hypothetical protein n=1 Tax=Rhizobium sp. BR 362 TaxID=3040670 RepID=UPI002F407A99
MNAILNSTTYRGGRRRGGFGHALAVPAQTIPSLHPDVSPSEARGKANDEGKLPVFRGTVAQYTLTPHGDVDGFILTDGTEVHVPPHFSTQLVFAVRPRDAVAVRGLRAYSIPMIAAVAVTNETTGQTVIDTESAAGPERPDDRVQPMTVQGRIKAALHGPAGDLNGAVLDDGTILRLRPPEAGHMASLLSPGESVVARGNGLITPMGNVLDVQSLGQAAR